ncbi:unnamed protein product, partial [Aphanomyces euteiches]
YQMGILEDSIVAKLDAMRFVWDDSQHKWDLTMEALEIFKKINGHVEVPQDFEISQADRLWPEYLWTMKLGLKVANIRARKNKLTLQQRQELDALDFVWDANKLHWNRNLSALKAYKQNYGNLRVPQAFVVPKDDPDWPSVYAKIKLGTVVNNLRRNQATLSDKKKRELNKLDFEWSAKS